MTRAAGGLAGLAAVALLAGCPQQAPPSASPAPTSATEVADEAIAYLDGEPITRAEVSAPAAFRIYRHEVDIYSLLRSETDALVDERLLLREAERRGVTPEALLAEVESAAEPVSEADVDRYLAEHPAEAGRAPEAELRPRVRHYLEERRRIEERLAFRDALRADAGFEWVLEPPVQPRTAVDVRGAPARGDAAAPVTVVHFASFGTRQSARSAEQIRRAAVAFPGAIRQIHRNHLDGADETSLLAARVGFLAQDAGRFWEFHDALFATDGPVDTAAIAAAAAAAGLGPDAIPLARADVRLLERVRTDQSASAAAGVPRAPTVFVNGRYLSGLLPYERLAELVAEELAPASPDR